MKHRGHFKSEKGAVTIIEATFVFPIVFFIVFFMIMAGEAYYQHARVEYAVTSAAINGAAECENPMLSTVIANKSVPTSPSAADVLPYRYIFTSEAKQISTTVRGDLESTVSAMKPLLFKNMGPHNVSVLDKQPSMNPFISSFPVECTFEIPFPIRMIFSTDRISIHYSVAVTASIGDPSEFVRNVSMVSDFLEMSETATEIGGKVKSAMSSIGEWVN